MAVRTSTYAWSALGIAVVALGGMYVASRQVAADPFGECRSSVIAGGNGSVGGPFTLTDENGARVTDSDVLTSPSLVYFGYTYCPDICPADTARNADVVDALEGMGHKVTPVFISVDPGRDTPAVLKEWTDYIHPRLIGLTGSPDEIKAAAQAYRTVYRVPDDRSDEYYLVDHMTQTYLMLPETGFVEFYSREAAVDDMAESVACFLDAAA